MKAARKLHIGESGLTLLEIIITFIIAALLGSMLVEYMGSSLTRGGESVVMVQDEFLLNGVVEKITADWVDLSVSIWCRSRLVHMTAFTANWDALPTRRCSAESTSAWIKSWRNWTFKSSILTI